VLATVWLVASTPTPETPIIRLERVALALAGRGVYPR
jgi:hypothetical protein